MKTYECNKCGNKEDFTMIKVTNIWNEQDIDEYSENIIEVTVCGKCKSTDVKIY